MLLDGHATAVKRHLLYEILPSRKKRIFTQPVKPHGCPKPVYFNDFEILMGKGRLSRKPASPLEGHNGPLASPGRRGRSGVAAAAAGGPRLESPPASSWKPRPTQFPAHKPHFTLPPPDKDAPSLSRIHPGKLSTERAWLCGPRPGLGPPPRRRSERFFRAALLSAR